MYTTKNRTLTTLAAGCLALAGFFGLTSAQPVQAAPGDSVPSGAGAVSAFQADQPMLSEGDHGPAVDNLQRLLTAHGNTTAVDGAFGPATQAAVRTFQQQRHLTADGIVGPRTWRALLTAIPGKPLPPIQAPDSCWTSTNTTNNYAYTCDFAIASGLGSNAQALKDAVFHRAITQFSGHFPFTGCGDVLKKGQACRLQPGNAPLQVIEVGRDSFVFATLPGHPEGINRRIQFRFFVEAGQLRLGVHAWGQPSAFAKVTGDGGVAYTLWGSYAQKGLRGMIYPNG
ncbi:peptidoglycan-binding domain-containing protein [Streptomyces lavendulae]|uniref:peptidoglycan-binding domain-containing protein n=1 Tax=Streptomyces lavendulae TaxID=1914 RepID=UPI0037FFCC48